MGLISIYCNFSLDFLHEEITELHLVVVECCSGESFNLHDTCNSLSDVNDRLMSPSFNFYVNSRLHQTSENIDRLSNIVLRLDELYWVCRNFDDRDRIDRSTRVSVWWSRENVNRQGISPKCQSVVVSCRRAT